MCGWVKLYRDVLETELWREVVPFRLFLLLLMQASREDGRSVNGIQLKRGQYIRAYSKLAEDLGYREGRGEKQYSKSTIKRAADKLIKKGLIATEETSVGTLFTLTKYEEVQTGGFTDFFYPSDRGTVAERRENEGETNPVQNQEREKKAEKEKKDDSVQALPKGQKEDAEKDGRIFALTQKFAGLRSRGTALSAKDQNELERVAALEIPLDQLLAWMEEIQNHYGVQPILSMKYYHAAILTRMKDARTDSGRKAESLKERMARLEKQGNLMQGGKV